VTFGAIAAALEAIEPYGALATLVAVAYSTAAVVRSFLLNRQTREFKAYMERERSLDMESLAGVLRGCRAMIARMRDMRDDGMYFRSLAAVLSTLQGPLLRHEAYIAHDSRRLVPILLTQLLAASAVEHRRSSAMLRVASRHVGDLIQGIEAPMANPASGV